MSDLRVLFSAFSFSFSALMSAPHPNKAAAKITIMTNDKIVDTVLFIASSPPLTGSCFHNQKL
jgi:hypothetical protein